MSECYFRNLSLGVVRLLEIENRSGHGRIVQDEAYRALALLPREILKRENVDACSARAWQSLPSVPSRSSKRTVNPTPATCLHQGRNEVALLFLLDNDVVYVTPLPYRGTYAINGLTGT
jgi:hypothetical protein